MQGEGEVLGVFVGHFHNGKYHWVADGEMFPIRMLTLDNISIRQMYRWKARFVGFFGNIFTSKINGGVYEKLAKSNDCSMTRQMDAAQLRMRA